MKVRTLTKEDEKTMDKMFDKACNVIEYYEEGMSYDEKVKEKTRYKRNLRFAKIYDKIVGHRKVSDTDCVWFKNKIKDFKNFMND